MRRYSASGVIAFHVLLYMQRAVGQCNQSSIGSGVETLDMQIVTHRAVCRADDGGAMIRRNLSSAFMAGLGRASLAPLRAVRSVSWRRHQPELPFMPGRGADIGPTEVRCCHFVSYVA